MINANAEGFHLALSADDRPVIAHQALDDIATAIEPGAYRGEPS